MRIVIASLFPGYFASPCTTSLLGRAQTSGLLDLHLVDIREYATDAHKTVDDRAYGGGPGMVMMAEPIAAALRDVTATPARRRVLYMTPQGTPLTAQRCREWASYEELIILCGHYEGIDERVIDAFVDEEVSIGDYVLTNGCLAALVVMDATLRFVPGVVGKEASTQEDSFEQGLFDHPHYTRPPVWEGRPVPPVLLGGDHEELERWRKAQARSKTAKVRPDLYMRHMLSQRESKPPLEDSSTIAVLKNRLEAIVLQVRCLKRTKKFYRNSLRWKPLREHPDRLVYSLGGMQQLEFIEGGSQCAESLSSPEKGMTFIIPDQAMRLDAGLIATSSGYRAVEGVAKQELGDKGQEPEIEMIWWEDPDGYRWLFRPKK